MMIGPPPPPPYFLIYPEDQREAMKAQYEADMDRWLRETRITMGLNLVMALIGPGCLLALAIFVIITAWSL